MRVYGYNYCLQFFVIIAMPNSLYYENEVAVLLLILFLQKDTTYMKANYHFICDKILFGFLKLSPIARGYLSSPWVGSYASFQQFFANRKFDFERERCTYLALMGVFVY